MADDKDKDDDDTKASNEELKKELFGGDAKPVKRVWPHVVSLHSSDNPEYDMTSALRKEVDIFKRNLPDMIEFYEYEARLTRARFLALVKEGFNECQALHLCRN